MELGKEECTECYGEGITLLGRRYWLRCKKCMGKGKLDWVERVVGPKNIPSNFDLCCRVKKLYGENGLVIDKIWDEVDRKQKSQL